MKTKSSLYIQIPKPCNEDWSLMQKAGDGKYCSRCSNVVYDLSGLNDYELLNFFDKNPNTHCGRFHNSQLQREILPQKNIRRLIFNRFNKIAAAVFTILSFKPISSQAEIRNTKPSLVFDADHKKNVAKPGGKIIITGRVRDAEGKLLEGAQVLLDSLKMAITDKNGEFHFELVSTISDSYNLYFIYEGLNTVVRSYHRAMQSTDYDIVLYKKGRGENAYTGGIFIMPLIDKSDLPDLVFATGSVAINKRNKSKLDVVSSQLNMNPYAAVDIRAFCNTSAFSEKIAKRRADEIKKYMTESQGVSPERITITILHTGGDVNTINFVNHDPNH